MIDSQLLETFLDIVLVVMVLLLLPTTWRVVVGPTPADRLQAIDTLTNMLVGIIVLLAMVQGTSAVVDLGTALAALAFISTLAIARYLCEGRMF